MLRAWSSDTSFTDCPTVGYFAPEGVQSFLTKLGKVADHLYAVTGSVAAAAFVEYAPAHQVQIYADHGEPLAAALELRPVDQGANVLVATPRSAAVFERTLYRDNVRVVAPAQAFADLLAGTGRHPQEAEHLLTWMTENLPEWRTALGGPTVT
jgi:hypothetical protein